MDKKTEQLTVHLTPEKKAQFLIFAELESLSGSELGARVIDDFLVRKHRQFELMAKAFKSPENPESR